MEHWGKTFLCPVVETRSSILQAVSLADIVAVKMIGV